MARVLLPIDEPLARADGRMAGLAVRVHEMAEALVRAGHMVHVATPDGARPALQAGYDVVPLAALGALPRLDVWVAHPRLVAGLAPRLARVPLVVDGYESPFGSYLAQATALLPTLGERVVQEYRAATVELLAAIVRADRVLAATEAQRTSYLTLLAALGRIGPRTPDPGVVLTVCSGAPPLPPEPVAVRDAASAPVLIWAGGCYPWFDVETPLAALPRIVEAVPEVRIVLAGLGGIDEAEDALLPKARRVREVVRDTPALAGRVAFVPWQPYAKRHELYHDADVALCSHGDHLETRLAMRTRVIDLVWGGVPVVASAGDEVGRLVAEHGAARLVPPADPAALADAATALLADPAARARMAERARALATGALSWDRQVAPLARYCDAVASEPRPRVADVAPAEAILRPNDGWARRRADALRALWWRIGRVSRRLATRGGKGAGS